MVFTTPWSIESQINYQPLGRLKYLHVINAIPVLEIYLFSFADSIIRKFQSTIIQPSLFDENKPSILIYVALCEKNEKNLKIFKKILHFTSRKRYISITWITKRTHDSKPVKHFY